MTIDLLAIQLFVLAFTGLLISYAILKNYLDFRQKKFGTLVDELSAAAIPLSFLGVYMVATGIFGQFTYPLPGTYNTLFYDVYTTFGLLVSATALAAYLKITRAFQYIGLFGLMLGAIGFLYGIAGYQIGLTKEPLALLALYISFGFAGIFSYPVALFTGRMFLSSKKTISKAWMISSILFLVFLVAGSALALYIGASAVPAHLA